MPSGSVNMSSSCMTCAATMYSLQAVMKLNSAVITSPGVASGRTTWRNAPAREQPSIRAASSSAGGIVS